MDAVTHMVDELAHRVFSSRATPPSAVESFDPLLWSTFCSTGLDRLLASGEPTRLRDATAMLRAAGFHAVRIPVVEAVLAHWLAAKAGWDETSPLPIAVAATAKRTVVPWGRSATALYFVQDGFIARCTGPLGIERRGNNIACEPRDEIARLTGAVQVSSVVIDADLVFCVGALCRAAMMAGAMEKTLEIVVAHAGQRVQFGRPIAKFQAVQQMLAQLAAHVAAVGAAVDLAVAGFSSLTAAVAKSRASEAVGLVTEIAHQVAGAMGYTLEFPLHLMTRRLWAWRDEDGTELFWNRKLGALAATRAGDGLWPLLSGTAAEPQWQP